MSREEYDEDEPLFVSAPSSKGVVIAHYRDRYEKGEYTPTHLIFELDARVHSQFLWNDIFTQVEEAIQEGFKVVFQLNLGLFSELQHPLRHEGQFQSLLFSMRYFREKISKLQSSDIFGVLLYRGDLFSITPPFAFKDQTLLEEFYSWLLLRGYKGDIIKDFSQIKESIGLSWNYVRFCYEESLEYIRNLSLEIPDLFHRCIQLDISNQRQIGEALLFSAKDLLSPLHPVLRTPFPDAQLYPIASSLYQCGRSGSMGSLFLDKEMGQISFQEEDSFSIAVLLPSYSSITYERTEALIQAIQLLSDKGVASKIKVVHEPFFTTEWHNIDYVIVSPSSLSKEGNRILHGFQAAGGEIIDVEIPDSLEKFLASY